MNGPESTTTCAHHWLLARPVDGRVDGVCKKCGARRSYAASLEEGGRPEIALESGDGRSAGRGRPRGVDSLAADVI